MGAAHPAHFLENTFCTQSMQLLKTAAKKPSCVNETSVAEQSASPPTTGTSDKLTMSDVRSPSIRREKITCTRKADATGSE